MAKRKIEYDDKLINDGIRACVTTLTMLAMLDGNSEREVFENLERTLNGLRAHFHDCWAYGGNPYNNAQVFAKMQREAVPTIEKAWAMVQTTD